MFVISRSKMRSSAASFSLTCRKPTNPTRTPVIKAPRITPGRIAANFPSLRTPHRIPLHTAPVAAAATDNILQVVLERTIWPRMTRTVATTPGTDFITSLRRYMRGVESEESECETSGEADKSLADVTRRGEVDRCDPTSSVITATKRSLSVAQFMHTLRSFTKSALSLVGLLEPTMSVYCWVAEHRFRCYYSQRDRYEVQIHDRKIVFSTEDGYSGRWFFPRYDGWIHEPKTTELLARLSLGAENTIDVGANLGWYSCIAASISDGTVHAFEMDMDNLRRLNTNVALNGLQNVRVNHAAVTDSEGQVSYWTEPGSAGVAHSFVRENDDKKERVRVDATTLDRYTADHCQSVDLIKIDAEGAAQKVLEGGKQAIRNFRPHILLEVHPSPLASLNTSPGEVLSVLPDTYSIYRVENFRGGGKLGKQPINLSTFAPDQISMLYAEPSDAPLTDYPPLTGPLYEFP